MTTVYLRTSRVAALADWITRRYGLEVPINYILPATQELRDTNDGLPMHHRIRYYSDGGLAWPERVMIEG